MCLKINWSVWELPAPGYRLLLWQHSAGELWSDFELSSPVHQLFKLRYSFMESFVFGKGGCYIIPPSLLYQAPACSGVWKKKQKHIFRSYNKKKTVQLLFLLFVNEKRTSPFFEWKGYKESENKYIYWPLLNHFEIPKVPWPGSWGKCIIRIQYLLNASLWQYFSITDRNRLVGNVTIMTTILTSWF